MKNEFKQTYPWLENISDGYSLGHGLDDNQNKVLLLSFYSEKGKQEFIKNYDNKWFKCGVKIRVIGKIKPR